MLHAIVSPRRFVLLIAIALLGHAPSPQAMEAIWQADILFQVNAARAAQTLPPLHWNDRLAATAAAHAADLQRCRQLTHEGCDGNSLPQRAAQAGYAFRRISENLALCPCDAAGVVQLWLLSDGHRRNLLDPDVSELGADTRADAADLRRQQWVLVMGRE
ncbi:MAG: CAP domain-containing protein [Ferrovibrio sp.]|uniref:CAP domain-containing protein n=1 Tax=Ferrovibrio sp. TaxID=1917215 RepID=UPI002606F3E5|nr:CAP domain-containing protein [Ferrovibrio sp.]MCW0235217.1 CAP domain-containing protein [Ferrovibrio sp.]